jgi:methylenetetrahydrofolate dehydrogenase (NADP+)/methenyltetrahydrofolate cyclohydrolase
VILVGDSQASQVYVRNKIKACEENGIHSVFEKYEASMTEAELLARVEALNNDPKIHGILVQLPLPAHIDSHKVIEAIAAEKDVDGFHISNAGLLMTGQPLFRPCTPYGVMKMLESIDYPVRGAHAVVVVLPILSANRRPCCSCKPARPSPSAIPRPVTSVITHAMPIFWWSPRASATL